MKTALILVDIQNDYFKGGQMELVGMDEAGTKAGRLLSYFRENDLSTFHIQHVASDPDLGFFLPNTDGVELHDSIKPLPGEPVIQKHYPNGFRETVLGEELIKAAVGRVVVCGAMSHMCIEQQRAPPPIQVWNAFSCMTRARPATSSSKAGQ